MKADEYLLFRKMTEHKKVILEYGSGGSTIHFIKRQKKIYSVDSNPAFYKYLLSIKLIKEAIGKSLFLKLIDLGDTDPWGRPLLNERQKEWPNYYLDIWKDIALNKDQVDLIFIDGRFRVCCCIYSLLQLMQSNSMETMFMIHDFWNRPEYHVLLKFLTEIKSASRLGCFVVKKDIDVNEAKEVLQHYSLKY